MPVKRAIPNNEGVYLPSTGASMWLSKVLGVLVSVVYLCPTQFLFPILLTVQWPHPTPKTDANRFHIVAMSPPPDFVYWLFLKSIKSTGDQESEG
jgi:hypothetical protein